MQCLETQNLENKHTIPITYEKRCLGHTFVTASAKRVEGVDSPCPAGETGD